MAKPGGASLDRFDPPPVVDSPITRFDDHGLGQEPNNLAAIGSLKGYRALRWGRNVEIMSNPDLSPHVSFVDMGGHGYSVVRTTSDSLETEFVCIPRPLERSQREDGGPLKYRVRSRAVRWKKGETPKLHVGVVEGDPKFSI